MKKIILSALAVLALAVAAPRAHAGNTIGYVCNVQLIPAAYTSPIGYGNAGALYVNLYTQPDCGGSYITYAYFYTTGANLVGTSTSFLYTAPELQALYGALVQWRNKPTPRQVILDSVNGGGQAYWLTFQ